MHDSGKQFSIKGGEKVVKVTAAVPPTRRVESKKIKVVKAKKAKPKKKKKKKKKWAYNGDLNQTIANSLKVK